MISIENAKGTVRFSFKDSIKTLEASKKQKSLIFMFFSFGGERLKYSTGYKSCYENWDFQKQRIKENKSGILNSREVNEYLSKLEVNIKKEFSRLMSEGVSINKSELKTFLDKYHNKRVVAEKKVIKSFFDYADDFINERNASVITIRSYKQTILKLKDYEKVYGEKLDFDSIDKSFYLRFNQYMNDKGYSLNTTAKHIKNLKVFLNNCLYEGYSTNTKFKSKDFKAKTEITTAIYLNENEIEIMHNLDLSSNKNRELARDIFLLGCYTGQRVSDYNGLKYDSIVEINGTQYFKIKQKKTKAIVHCPITKEIREIMDRNGGLPPKKMNEQYINKFIKEVGLQMKLKDKISCVSTVGGKEIIELIPRYKLLHTHSARRSFCSNMYKKGMPVIDIRLFSGHKSERELYKYIRIENEERASHVVSQGFFNI